MIVIDKQNCIIKVETLLEQQETYRYISADPNNKQKNKLINPSKDLKARGDIGEKHLQGDIPTGASSLKFYGLPKIHNKDILIIPIVVQ